MAPRDQQISDFPLCNKSFNLSTVNTTFKPSRRTVQRSRSSRSVFASTKWMIAYPAGDRAGVSRSFRGLPVLDESKCPEKCQACIEACPTDAISRDGRGLALDLGRRLSAPSALTRARRERFATHKDDRLATRCRDDLVVRSGQALELARPLERKMLRVFGRSLKLRQVTPAVTIRPRPT